MGVPIEKFVAKLEAMTVCPNCGGSRWRYETFDLNTFEFAAEAVFHCGANIKATLDDGLKVSDGCRQELENAVDEIISEISESEDA